MDEISTVKNAPLPLFTVIDQVACWAAPAGMNWKPESTPLALGTQGEVKVDWVTVWFLDMNWKLMVSPALAVTLRVDASEFIQT